MQRLVIGCLVVALLGVSSSGTEGDEDAREGKDLAAMAEDIEIMQRIIDRALQQYFAGDEPKVQLLEQLFEKRAGKKGKSRKAKHAMSGYYDAVQAYSLASSRSTQFHIVGYYIPGTGVLYTLDLPTDTKEVDVQEGEDELDLWQEIEGRLRGGRADAPSYVQEAKCERHTVVDNEALDRTVALLVQTIGEYGSRIEQLSMGESITLAARVRARNLTRYVMPLLATSYGLLGQNAQDLRSHRVIVNVPVRAIRDFESGRIDVATLNERAEITKYRSPVFSDNIVAATLNDSCTGCHHTDP